VGYHKTTIRSNPCPGDKAIIDEQPGENEPQQVNTQWRTNGEEVFFIAYQRI